MFSCNLRVFCIFFFLGGGNFLSISVLMNVWMKWIWSCFMICWFLCIVFIHFHKLILIYYIKNISINSLGNIYPKSLHLYFHLIIGHLKSKITLLSFKQQFSLFCYSILLCHKLYSASTTFCLIFRWSNMDVAFIISQNILVFNIRPIECLASIIRMLKFNCK